MRINTKESIADTIEGLEMLVNRGIQSVHIDMAIAGMRRLLASLEAEPVCYLTWHQGFRAPDDCEEYVVEAKPGDKSCDGSPAFAVYAAPPVPVSVPDENGLFPCPFCGGRPEEDAGGCSEYDGHEHQDYSINCKSCGAEVYCAVGSFEKADIPCSCHHNAREVCVEKWNRRAAMLQGADGNSPVIPDGWVACSERMPEKADEVLCAKEFDGPGDWRQKVGYYLAGKWTVYSASWTPTHWMPLPAAPQQEVK